MPDTIAKANELKQVVVKLAVNKENIDIDKVERDLYNIYGDDEMFDELDALRADNLDVVHIIRKHVKALLPYEELSPEINKILKLIAYPGETK